MKKRNWQNSIIAELINNRPKRTPKCWHFLYCGGCSLQDFDYSDQLAMKAKKVTELFQEYGIGTGGNVRTITQLPDDGSDLNAIEDIKIYGEAEWGYRTRMDFVVGRDGIGLRRRRRFDEIECLQECYILENGVLQLGRKVFDEGVKVGLVPYDLKTHTGEWRYVSVRVNEKNEVMLILVTKSGVEEKVDELITKLQISNSKFQISNFKKLMTEDQQIVDNELVGKLNNDVKIVSVYHVINDGLADVNFGETRKYWGDEFLKLEIDDLNFEIGPNTFFQNNIAVVNTLVEKIGEYVDKDDKVLDLYCGVGTLSLPIAGRCQQVLGVELMAESIELAKVNAENNKIENVEFVAQGVEDFLRERKSGLNDYKVLVVDPPRKGLEKAAESLLALDFDKMIYMSCNPLSLVKDLQVLGQKWVIVEVTLWDLYPQTPHVEVLVRLVRK